MTPSPELMLELLKDIWAENGRHFHLDAELAHRLRDLLATVPEQAADPNTAKAVSDS